MTSAEAKCRRLGFPALKSRGLGELRPVEVVQLFAFLFEVWELEWSWTAAVLCKGTWRPVPRCMRLLDLCHKCPGAKQIKHPNKHIRSIASSLSAVIDKLESRYGADALYKKSFLHPSLLFERTQVNERAAVNDASAKQSLATAAAEHCQAKGDAVAVGSGAVAAVRHSQGTEKPRSKVKLPKASLVSSVSLKSGSVESALCSALASPKKDARESEESKSGESVTGSLSTTKTINMTQKLLAQLFDDNSVIGSAVESDVEMKDGTAVDCEKENVALGSERSEVGELEVGRRKRRQSMKQKLAALRTRQLDEAKRIQQLQREFQALSYALYHDYHIGFHPFDPFPCLEYAQIQVNSVKQFLTRIQNTQ